MGLAMARNSLLAVLFFLRFGRFVVKFKLRNQFSRNFGVQKKKLEISSQALWGMKLSFLCRKPAEQADERNSKFVWNEVLICLVALLSNLN